MFYILFKSVAQEQTSVDGKYVDHIDKLAQDIERKESKIQCLQCVENGFTIYYEKSKRVCDICKKKLREANKLKISESQFISPTSKCPLIIPHCIP